MEKSASVKAQELQEGPRSFALLSFSFGATLFLSAGLLFSVQPLVGKLLLPLLGGAPAVWNTVMVFFQAMLLAGYAYAHWSIRALGPRTQPWLHAGLLILAAIELPFALRPEENTAFQSNHPALWAMLALARFIGVPVFVLASTAPLLQKWFATSRHPSRRDPYFLYAASNVGSFAALFAYPLLIEPFFPLNQQIHFWSAGFWMLAVCVVACAWIPLRSRVYEAPHSSASRPASVQKVPRKTVLKWIGLSLVPSSLMLGVTNYITTDVASIPLLWVLPLALYLFTFVIAFSRHSKIAERSSRRVVPILSIAVVFPILVQATEPVLALVILHLAFFFVAALQCHLKLAEGRPEPEHLTTFYLCMSVGGVLGGIFNALLAPIIFTSIVEYPLMILVATLIAFPEKQVGPRRFTLPPIYGGCVIVLVLATASAIASLVAANNILLGNIFTGILLLISYFFFAQPVRFTVALATLLLSASHFHQSQNRIIDRDRNFFGVLRVTDDDDKPLRRLFHGTTIHGVQFTTPERRCEPLSYYHAQGPVSEIAKLFRAAPLPRTVGLVGLGAGAMICYSNPDEKWTLYEIDPAVIRIASDTNYFTYLSDCARAPFSVQLGDARLRLRQAGDAQFGILYLDAFSSDVIPMHLLTREAFQLYRQKLAPNGILAFHLSSRHFELEPLVANLGAALNLLCFTSTKGDLSPAAIAEGGLESVWVILVNEGSVPSVAAAGTWQRVLPDKSAPLWTDDFSSLIGVLKLD